MAKRSKKTESDQDFDGGHNQASHSPVEAIENDGGHSQSSTNHADKQTAEGGHSQGSIGRKPTYGRNGRYNDNL